jgi:hypothetical protein
MVQTDKCSAKTITHVVIGLLIRIAKAHNEDKVPGDKEKRDFHGGAVDGDEVEK